MEGAGQPEASRTAACYGMVCISTARFSSSCLACPKPADAADATLLFQSGHSFSWTWAATEVHMDAQL
jgi:hypothetical protein